MYAALRVASHVDYRLVAQVYSHTVVTALAQIEVHIIEYVAVGESVATRLLDCLQ